MMNKIRTKSGAGFTLIELMIVIAIIGILAAIAVPNFNRARAQAKKKSCVANMKTIEGAVELYNMENAVSGATPPQPTSLQSNGYLKSIPRCPSKGTDNDYTVTSTAGTSGMTDVKCADHGLLSKQEKEDKTTGM
jgi:prepilin-type N-terminal cleavage/methylation domain-containing protein